MTAIRVLFPSAPHFSWFVDRCRIAGVSKHYQLCWLLGRRLVVPKRHITYFANLLELRSLHFTLQ